MAKKKIKDLTLKEFYLWQVEQLKKARPFCFGRDPLEFVRDITVTEYLKERGDMEVEVEENE